MFWVPKGYIPFSYEFCHGFMGRKPPIPWPLLVAYTNVPCFLYKHVRDALVSYRIGILTKTSMLLGGNELHAPSLYSVWGVNPSSFQADWKTVYCCNQSTGADFVEVSHHMTICKFRANHPLRDHSQARQQCRPNIPHQVLALKAHTCRLWTSSSVGNKIYIWSKWLLLFLNINATNWSLVLD